MKLETYEMDRFKRLNEDVLDDETHPSLIDVCTALLKDLEGTMLKFSVVAKQRGFKYEASTKKGSSKEGKSEQLGADSQINVPGLVTKGSMDSLEEIN
jgi:hypothetical protein